MTLIKFNCILVLTWESCKSIHWGNVSTFLSPTYYNDSLFYRALGTSSKHNLHLVLSQALGSPSNSNWKKVSFLRNSEDLRPHSLRNDALA